MKVRKMADKNAVNAVYDKISSWFDEARTKDLSLEKKVLSILESSLAKQASILDVGCGTGEPLARYFIERGYQYTGIDNSVAMLSYCRARFPNHTWQLMDMRQLKLEKQFDCIVAWHSFFHIQREQQALVLERFLKHLKPGGMMVFTTGEENGETWSNNGGEMLYHASLASKEYQKILEKLSLEVILHSIADLDCGGATIWIAQRR